MIHKTSVLIPGGGLINEVGALSQGDHLIVQALWLPKGDKIKFFI